MELVFATNNAHKLEEVRAILGERITLKSLSDIEFSADLPETTGTIPGNALQKARTVFEHTGLPCFADDTGLEIEALDGNPGVDSAHFAGPERDAQANMNLVLQQLSGIANRNARFLTVIAYVCQEGEFLFEGEVKGLIALHPAGSGGFGYDPIFIPEGYSESFAHLDASVKNQISHRARATAVFASWLIQKHVI